VRTGWVSACAAVLIGALCCAGAASAGVQEATEAYPPLGLTESSGMAASALHDGVVWVVEDGALDQSLPPVVHGYDPAGTEVATVTLEGWNNRDVEALSLGPGPTLWVADIGDNSRGRETVVVHTFMEPDELGTATLTPVSYRLRYPDGARDAESLMVDPLGGRLYLATKSVIGGGSLYAAPAALVAGETHDLGLVGPVPSFVTDAAFTPDGQRVVLLVPSGLGTAEVRVMDVARNGDGSVTDLVEASRIELPEQEQPESITVTPDGGAVLVGSEGENEPVWSVPLPAPDTPVEPPAASTDPSAPVVQPGNPPAEPSAGCRLSDPRSCLDTPFGFLAVGAVALAALLVGALAVLRRSRE
jgi:hypothetical protein